MPTGGGSGGSYAIFNGGTITNPLIIAETVASGASAYVLEITDPGKPDLQWSVEIVDDGAGNAGVQINVDPQGDSDATFSMDDDNLDGGVQISTGRPSLLHARSTVAEGTTNLEIGTVGAIGTRFLRDGVLVVRAHAAPSDAAIGAGECALWFDQTNGSARLMVKAKSANGTVATGSLALT